MQQSNLSLNLPFIQGSQNPNTAMKFEPPIDTEKALSLRRDIHFHRR